MNEHEQGIPAGATPEPAELPSETIEGLRAQLDEERNRAQAYYGSWQRERADFQNFKRRTDDDRQKGAMFANVALVMNLLPVVDDLERAIAGSEQNNETAAWVEGVRAIIRKFTGALEAAGVKEIAADGQPFDPNRHEAVMHEPGEPDQVVRVLQKGYTMGERVLRPAMVSVGQG